LKTQETIFQTKHPICIIQSGAGKRTSHFPKIRSFHLIRSQERIPGFSYHHLEVPESNSISAVKIPQDRMISVQSRQWLVASPEWLVGIKAESVDMFESFHPILPLEMLADELFAWIRSTTQDGSFDVSASVEGISLSIGLSNVGGSLNLDRGSQASF
jgi:hypothetical protein